MPLSAIDSSFGLGGWAIVILMAPGLIVLIGIVCVYVLRRPNRADPAARVPGYYHVLGIDQKTGERREATFHADSRLSAQGRAEMDGIMITEIKLREESK